MNEGGPGIYKDGPGMNKDGPGMNEDRPGVNEDGPGDGKQHGVGEVVIGGGGQCIDGPAWLVSFGGSLHLCVHSKRPIYRGCFF